MAKRFTDTDKWNKAWIRRLSPKFKCAWFYLLDKCDHAGVWQEDFEAMSFNIGEEITQEDFEKVFNEKIQKVDSDKYFIKSFIDFQYGNLNPSNKVHKSVLERLEKVKPLTSPMVAPIKAPYDGAKEAPIEGAKDKDKEKDKEKVKDKEKEKEINPSQVLNLWNEIFLSHPKIKPAPFFLAPNMVEDFHLLTGFEGFRTIEAWKQFFNLIKKTPYLCGENQRGWIVSFSWAIKPDNAVKILDGSYQGTGVSEKANGENKASEIVLETEVEEIIAKAKEIYIPGMTSEAFLSRFLKKHHPVIHRIGIKDLVYASKPEEINSIKNSVAELYKEQSSKGVLQ